MNADRFAPWYRLVEFCAFGRQLEAARRDFLSHLADAQSILVPGEGDGRTLAWLLPSAPNATIDVVESSHTMISLARGRIGDNQRVRFLNDDARTLPLSLEVYDAVVTCFFLDCFNEDECRFLISKLMAALRPGGLWLLSDFAIPSRGWKRLHARIWIRTMYAFFRITTGLQTQTLPSIAHLMSACGMIPEPARERKAQMIVSGLWRKPKDS